VRTLGYPTDFAVTDNVFAPRYPPRSMLDQEGVAACLILPRNPVEFDVRRWLETYGELFAHIVQTDDTLRLPSPDPLLEACAALGVSPHATVVVGLSPDLIKGAKAARCIACQLRAEGPDHSQRLKDRPEHTVLALAEVPLVVHELIHGG
jgi:beta-phosphoglucomutase-like phosphatase (HAD superfamily)